ncbi:MAG: hypothetical protein ACXVXW_15300 [Mycobacteriaceae bacterium]
MAHPSSSESPLPWTADALATQLADVIADNYYEPSGDLPDVGYDGPDELGRCVIWAVSAGAVPRMVVVVQSVDEDSLPSGL